MKEGIHPQVEAVTVYCACGNEIKTFSSRSDIRASLCSQCHPFYTGANKFVDTAGRIDKFKKKYNVKA